MEPEVIIIGAGLSGLSAGAQLIEKGKKVLILEERDVLGGRTSSWNDNGMHIESGLHRYLGFFESLPNLLNKAGVNIDDIVYWEDKIIIHPDNTQPATFGLSPLHKPVKTLGGLISNNDFLDPAEKIKIAKFFTEGFIDHNNKPDYLDSITVFEYSKKHDLNKETIKKVIYPLTEGLFFLSPEKYSAFNLFNLFSPYLKKLHKTRVGSFLGGMTEIMINPIADYIKKEGGVIKTNSTVTEIITNDNLVKGVIVNGKPVFSKQIIVAVSLDKAQELLPKSFKKHNLFNALFTIPSMPAVTFQIDLKEPSAEDDTVRFSPGTILASYAEQSRTTFKSSKGRISIILSEPEKYLKMPDKKILELMLKDAKKLDLNISADNILDYRSVKWKKDFYSYEKGTDKLRPSQETPIKGLVLAGDYTRQKYMSTMEGAVESGKLAMEVVVNG